MQRECYWKKLSPELSMPPADTTRRAAAWMIRASESRFNCRSKSWTGAECARALKLMPMRCPRSPAAQTSVRGNLPAQVSAARISRPRIANDWQRLRVAQQTGFLFRRSLSNRASPLLGSRPGNPSSYAPCTIIIVSDNADYATNFQT